VTGNNQDHLLKMAPISTMGTV